VLSIQLHPLLERLDVEPPDELALTAIAARGQHTHDERGLLLIRHRLHLELHQQRGHLRFPVSDSTSGDLLSLRL
jgi:hypothetical protein